MDCEWCVVDTDGLTPLDKPFCSTQRTCFAGVLGAPTPYDDGKKVETGILTKDKKKLIERVKFTIFFSAENF